MGGAETVGTLLRYFQKFRDTHRRRATLAQRNPFYVLHDQENLALVLKDVVDCSYVWMTKSGGALGFL